MGMTNVEATKRGKALLKRVKGRGWKLDVWENLGWHYAVRNGPLTVYADRYTKDRSMRYSTLLGGEPKDRHCGSLNWSPPSKGYRDPNRAVRAQLKAARAYVNQVDALVTDLEDSIQPRHRCKR